MFVARMTCGRGTAAVAAAVAVAVVTRRGSAVASAIRLA